MTTKAEQMKLHGPCSLPGKSTARRFTLRLAGMIGALGVILSIASTGHAETIVENHNFSGFNGAVPDGDPVGWVDSQMVTSDIFNIEFVSVTVNISTEFNGDLYAYLTHDSGFAVLLNRVGRTGDNLFGYGDEGFDITFFDTASNGDIHIYQDSVVPEAGLPLTGIWQPDGRNVDPDTVTDQSTRDAFLGSFEGLNANGEWNLFVADMSGGTPTTVNSWGMEVTGVIPEPGAYALIFGLAAFVVLAGRARQRR